MTLWDVITSTREQYLEGYRTTLRQQRDAKADFAVELPVMAQGGPAELPEDYRVFRVDFIWRENGQARVGVFQAGEHAIGGACQTEYPDGQVVRVVNLRWDDCEFRCAPAANVDGPLREWLKRWSDREGNKQADEDGLSSVVHSTTPPQSSPDGKLFGFAVDFGSAPPEAFTALVATLFAAGVREIRVGR